MSGEARKEKALFKPVKGDAKEVSVHFNPVSLQLAITNTLEEKGQDKKQFVTKSVAKLTMDLIFDTTDTGEDVRVHTQKVAAFMEPDKKKIPTIVSFEWGTYKFQGLIESYKETIDFFATTGVPLRATINLTLSRQEKVFEKSDPDKDFNTQQSLEGVEVPSGANQDATSMGSQGGNPQAGRGIAAANGLESMRFSGGAPLTVGASVQLGAPVAFASGGAGLSLGGGVGVSGGAGVSVGAGAGLSIGGSASAGVSASEGAFAGLRVQASSKQTASVDTSLLIKRSDSMGVATDSGASFSVGGKARIEGSTSLSADVGASASLKSRIQFED